MYSFETEIDAQACNGSYELSQGFDPMLKKPYIPGMPIFMAHLKTYLKSYGMTSQGVALSNLQQSQLSIDIFIMWSIISKQYDSTKIHQMSPLKQKFN